jgi:hypothetical protein
MKVLRIFKCIKENKKYYPGDDYKGDRLKEFQDLGLVAKPAKKPAKKKQAAKKGD